MEINYQILLLIIVEQMMDKYKYSKVNNILMVNLKKLYIYKVYYLIVIKINILVELIHLLIFINLWLILVMIKQEKNITNKLIVSLICYLFKQIKKVVVLSLELELLLKILIIIKKYILYVQDQKNKDYPLKELQKNNLILLFLNLIFWQQLFNLILNKYLKFNYIKKRNKKYSFLKSSLILMEYLKLILVEMY